MSGPTLRVAVAGSASLWPDGAAWESLVTDALWEQTQRVAPEGTLILRHGDADKGPDSIAARWIREAIEENLRGVRDRFPDVTLVEERLPADWDNCVAEPYIDVRGGQVRRCPETVNGGPHRRPNPGWPHNPRRGRLETYCPSAGHRRNPDVVAHPEHPVNVLLAWVINDSPGTSSTVEHARRARVPRSLKYYYL